MKFKIFFTALFLFFISSFFNLAKANTAIPVTTSTNWNFRIDGAQAGDFFGYYNGTKADINGDGIDDLIITTQSSSYLARTSIGITYVIYSSLLSSYSGTGNIIDLSDPTKYNLKNATGVNSITIRFVNLQTPVNYFALEYGTKPGIYLYGSNNIGDKNTTSYVVKYLSPNTTYYFRVRAGNGCATGTWSNEISATTLRSGIYKNLEVTNSNVSPIATTNKNMESHLNEYELKIKVVDTNKKPISGAKVILHSTPRETTTDKNGVADFKSVEAGEHSVVIAYAGYTGQQTVNLSGDTKEINLNITVKNQNPFLANPVISVITILLGIIFALCFMLLRSRKRIKHTNNLLGAGSGNRTRVL